MIEILKQAYTNWNKFLSGLQSFWNWNRVFLISQGRVLTVNTNREVRLSVHW